MFFHRFIFLFLILLVSCAPSESVNSDQASPAPVPSAGVTSDRTSPASVFVAGDCDFSLGELLDWVEQQSSVRFTDVTSAYCKMGITGLPHEVIVIGPGIKLFIGQGAGMAASGADSYITICVEADNAVARQTMQGACERQNVRNGLCTVDTFELSESTYAVTYRSITGEPKSGFCSFGGAVPFTPNGAQ